MKPFTDEEIIGAIQSGGQASEEALRHLYLSGGLRREAVMAARRFGGNEADVEDLFQEGLWRVYENLEHIEKILNCCHFVCSYFCWYVNSIRVQTKRC